jgi:hypothetical protein
MEGSEPSNHIQDRSEFVTLASVLEHSWHHAVGTPVAHRMIRSHEHADPSHSNHGWLNSCLEKH